jgi:biopolymer transport protein ExbD
MARRRAAEPGLEVNLPITPMLDMAFQIFMFFAFLYHPSALEGHVDTDLLEPEVKKEKVKQVKPDNKGGSTPKKEDLTEEVRDSLVVIVKSLTDEDLRRVPAAQREEFRGRLGSPKELSLYNNNTKSFEKDTPEDQPLDEGETNFARDSWTEGLHHLEEKLKSILLRSTGKSTPSIEIQPDGDLRYDFFIQVSDVCKMRYGVDTKGGKKILVRLDTQQKAAQYKDKTVGFEKVGYKPPPEFEETPKKEPGK